MPDLKIKSYTDQSGKRTTLRLDPETWQAIELIAARKGLNWAEWVHRIPSSYESRTTDIRAAVVAGLLNFEKFSFKGGDISTWGAPSLMMDAVSMTDEQFASDLTDDANFLDNTGPFNFGGFLLRSGTRQGKHAVWIENGLRGMPHVAVPIPDWIGQMAVINDKLMKTESAA